MACDFARVERETAHSACTCKEEAAARDRELPRGTGQGHTP
jgi:hypothetical protein